MKLSDYLAEHDLTDLAFAAQIGRNPTTVGRIRKAEVLPDWETVRRIQAATDGLVTANDFVPAATANAPGPEKSEAAA